MKSLPLLLLTAFVPKVAPAETALPPLPVVIFAGQSHMVGHGAGIDNLPVELQYAQKGLCFRERLPSPPSGYEVAAGNLFTNINFPSELQSAQTEAGIGKIRTHGVPPVPLPHRNNRLLEDTRNSRSEISFTHA